MQAEPGIMSEKPIPSSYSIDELLGLSRANPAQHQDDSLAKGQSTDEREQGKNG